MSILEPESGIWYSLCWVVVITRLISRRLHLGEWRNLQLDDYLIIVAMLTDTILMACMHFIIKTSSNLIAPHDDVSKFSSQEIQVRVFGSKLVLVAEQMQILTIWLVKTCLLLLYNRMTVLLPHHKIVMGTAIYVGISFVVMEILYFGVWCRPFSQYFAVPTSSVQCSAATNHLITNAVFNISSDIIIILIPMPILFKAMLPNKNKAGLIGVFLIGVFTIVASILNKYYSFTNPFGVEWTIWYLRESYTALLCANLPLIYPLIQRAFNLHNWSYKSNYGTGQLRGSSGPNGALSAMKSNAATSKLQSGPSSTGTIRRAESQEWINGGGSDDLRIYHNTEFFVTSAVELDVIGPPKNQTSVEAVEIKTA
ncbi:hypothetical protein K505DRAFT_342444 [Melanomma pulvis-pyrius CBS 109.77]|uniref:Rhodopsin domain-containing protein n=1 Tax=Melanomma pulvis-pyrius CBS 109.77 TaxID=1314802 RepID=A0A6A6WVU8_9PLEO|nr:hypothetical protein K505DRAFT_342444 [Melanomma pulvis-pyrius CBS 109.77]